MLWRYLWERDGTVWVLTVTPSITFVAVVSGSTQCRPAGEVNSVFVLRPLASGGSAARCAFRQSMSLIGSTRWVSVLRQAYSGWPDTNTWATKQTGQSMLALHGWQLLREPDSNPEDEQSVIGSDVRE
jgi:hypothetical protein